MPLTATQRFARSHEGGDFDLSLTRAKVERLKAEEWLTHESKNKYAAFRGMAELEGALVWYQRKLGGEIGADERAEGVYTREIQAIKREIRRRRRYDNQSEEKQPVQRKRVSPGRPRKVQPSLPSLGRVVAANDSHDTDRKKRA